MTASVLTSDAQEALRKAICTLRALLLDELGRAAKGEYQLDVGADKARLSAVRRARSSVAFASSTRAPRSGRLPINPNMRAIARLRVSAGSARCAVTQHTARRTLSHAPGPQR